MIGHHACLRDVTGPYYPIYACTLANHTRYWSGQLMFCDSCKHSLFKFYLKILDRYNMSSIWSNIILNLSKTPWTKSERIVVVFAVIICTPE